MASWKETLYKKLRRTLFLENIFDKQQLGNQIQITEFLEKNLYQNPLYAHKLNKFEFQAFSQFGEDGIIEEIFNRIGTTNKYFVEFGVEDGTETNTTYLLLKDWSGLWIDGSADNVAEINKHFSGKIASKQLKVIQRFIRSENIESIFAENGVPAEPDLLSIDIDRNDYYVWEAITHYKPRVVVIEYNAIMRPGCSFKVAYDGEAVWDGTSHTGASLEALCELGNQKGYRLVGCSYAGVNAFFVREDFATTFASPYTTEHYYEPPRYFLYHKPGHPRRPVM